MILMIYITIVLILLYNLSYNISYNLSHHFCNFQEHFYQQTDNTHHHQLNKKLIYYYYAADNDLDKLVSKDITYLTSYNPVNTDIHCIIDTHNFGTYKLNYTSDNGFWNKNIMKNINMNNMHTLENLFNMNKNKNSYNEIIFIYAGHGDSFSIHPEKNGYTSIETLASLINKHFPNKLDIIIFDACLMSSFENLYTLRNSTNYIMACENFGFNIGFMTNKTIEYIDIDSPDNSNISKYINILNNSLENINKDPETLVEKHCWNASLLTTKFANDIFYSINQIDAAKIPKFEKLDNIRLYKPKNKILDDTSYVDFYELINSLDDSGSDRIIKNDIMTNIKKSILHYVKNKNCNDKFHGLSICTTTRLFNYKIKYTDLEIYKKSPFLQKIHRL